MMRSSTVVLPRLVAAVTACVALAALAGCYGPSFDPCHVACAADSECPGGTACGSDLRCHVADQPICAVAGDAGVDGGDPDAALPVGSFKSLTVGVRFACGIDADDQLLCWGDNSSGQLGDGTFVSRAAAAPVTEPGPWKAVSAGSAHACGIKTSGALYCWGNDAWGQLTGVFGGWETSPIEVTTLPVGALWKAVAPGYAHTCAIRADDGVMWCWGANFAGQLGTGQPEGVFLPAAIPGHEAWAEVSSANLHTCARKDDGSAWCWGLGPLGQAGADPSTSSDRPVEVAGGHTWRSLATGLEHACGVTDGGDLYCWGTDVAGEIGTTQSDTPTPVVAEPGSDFETAFAGTHLSCATRSGGAAVCFGTNDEGQLGQGNRDDLRTLVTLPVSAAVTTVGIGDTTACALDVDGVVWCWGRDDHGQAGDGHADARFVGVPVQGIAGTPVQLSSTNHHTCARTDDGRVFCWGANEAGQLGDGTDQDRATAVEVPRQNAMPWDWISAGWTHSCAVSETRLFCWGADNYGQLGNGTTPATSSPTRIAPAVTWSYVDASGFQTCALDDGGARWCWGDDSGDGTGDGDASRDFQVSPTQSPVSPGPAAWAYLAGGANAMCGLGAGADDGELWCWGTGAAGELGVTSPPATSAVPLRVADPSADWTQIATDQGYGSTCGIRGVGGMPGALYCWGSNDFGQLGIDGAGRTETPAEVDGGHGWRTVELGYAFACGIDEDDALYCWGVNDFYQVSPTEDYRITMPRTSQVAPGTTFTWVAAGDHHACAIAGDAKVYCWGDGSHGELGDGNQAHRSPTPVVLAP